ncbi:hypothetical protein FOL47_000275 [Perkinsus chesapeaki]|uniref:G patch domain-containing protein n=1 Tax=Perkinsus chesapeaki TaxID=330153 RepID=A0A7J6MM75_PERCH|nr:hypothetical protein FOL47_000275 [Perkinsus chesapeaki]
MTTTTTSSSYLGNPLTHVDIDEIDRVQLEERNERYYNTVGTKEGWTPSTFVSSRSSSSYKNHDNDNDRRQKRHQKISDFMDDEDYNEGIGKEYDAGAITTTTYDDDDAGGGGSGGIEVRDRKQQVKHNSMIIPNKSTQAVGAFGIGVFDEADGGDGYDIDVYDDEGNDYYQGGYKNKTYSTTVVEIDDDDGDGVSVVRMADNNNRLKGKSHNGRNNNMIKIDDKVQGIEVG